MKKKIVSIAMVIAMTAGLTACGGSQTVKETGGTTAAVQSENVNEASSGGWEPSSTVSIVVPAGAGGDTDLSARVFAQYAKEITGHDFVVVNSNGASGSVAANQVLESAPDGHTFLYGHTLVNVANIAGITDYNYTAFKLGPNFTKEAAQQLYVNGDKYKNMDEFIAAAKAAPGQLKACTEVGAYTYYELLAFEKAAGIDLDLIDVGSNADKITALLSGQVDLMPGTYVNCKDYVEAGQFVCIGAPLPERNDTIPEIPTLKEQGIDQVYPDLDFSFYFPKETPDEAIAWYDNLVKTMLEDPEVAEAVAGLSMIPYYLSPEDAEANEQVVYETIKGIADSLQ